MVDADCRPLFAELGDEFTKMAKDPGRYLVIEVNILINTHVTFAPLVLLTRCDGSIHNAMFDCQFLITASCLISIFCMLVFIYCLNR